MNRSIDSPVYEANPAYSVIMGLQADRCNSSLFEALPQRAVEGHLEALRAGKTSLMISPRHDEARKVAAVVRQQLKAEGAIGPENYPVTVLRRMDLGPEARQDLLH